MIIKNKRLIVKLQPEKKVKQEEKLIKKVNLLKK